jgi:hypothetical protein
MAEAFSCRSATAKAGVHCQLSPRGFWGGQSDRGQVRIQILRISTVSISLLVLNTHNPFLHHRLCLR